jgi:Dolichyl-phosphate-mannose-protein mannosyltransferase
MLSLSIASRRFEELLHPLAYGQVSTIPFLWAERLAVVLLGINERALRALPFLAGIILCLGIAAVARRFLRSDETLVAAVLTVFSHVLIRYSAEVKPYSLDALLTLALIGAAVALLREMDNRRSWVVLGLAGTVALASSLPSPFVCAGVVLALSIQAFRERRVRLLPRIGLLGLFWAGLFSVLYSRFYRTAGNAPYMRDFWEGAFLTPGSPHFPARAHRALVEVSSTIDPGLTLLGLGSLALALALYGAAILHRRGQGPHAVLLLVPGVAPVVASVLGVYPVATRLMLFAAPCWVMLMGVGTIGAARVLHGLVPRVPMRWAAALLLLPVVTSGFASLLYQRDQQMRPVVQELSSQWRDGEAVYVFHRVVPAWLFYSTNWSAPDLRRLAWAMRVSGPGGLGHENGPARGSRPPGEGEDLVYELSGHPVLLGVSSGVQGRRMSGHVAGPDPGWARNEGRRIRNAASYGSWIVLGNASSNGSDLGAVLLEAVKQNGGRVTFEDSLQDEKLYRVEFDGSLRSSKHHEEGGQVNREDEHGPDLGHQAWQRGGVLLAHRGERNCNPRSHDEDCHLHCVARYQRQREELVWKGILWNDGRCEEQPSP